nr:MAG TPA: host-nuclease inhibitor protein [Caudoviricetes sp.]
MAKNTNKRLKAATLEAPQSREETQSWIKTLGDTQREHARLTHDLNDKIAELTDAAKPALNALAERSAALQQGIQTWCEANRAELTVGGGKTANLITGEVSWRQRPPSIAVRGIESVLENLRTLGLARFIRQKEEVNKEAMLNEPDIAATIAGITVVRGKEDFVIVPFEVETQP